LLHSAWIDAAGLDAAYVPFAPADEPAFERLVRGFRGGAIRGLNVTAPFKEVALALADRADETATRAGSANLLLFEADGSVEARSTDGEGMIGAFHEQAPDVDLAAAPAVVLGAGGAARAAVVALLQAGAPEVRVVNRTPERAEELAKIFGERVKGCALAEVERAFADAGAVINAAAGGPLAPVDALPDGAAVMDMTYRPLETALLRAARARGLKPVDGLAMLIRQAAPSFFAFYGVLPPDIDVRSQALEVLAP
jgi:shikimate dehydrogenase